MPLLNYTTTVDTDKTVLEILARLGEGGAQQVAVEYRERAPVGVTFVIETLFGPRRFALPASTEHVLEVLERERVPPRYRSVDQARRVGWRILKDWVEAQMALVEVEMVTLDQVMLPYMLGEGGQSVYEVYQSQQMALPAGRSGS